MNALQPPSRPQPPRRRVSQRNRRPSSVQSSSIQRSRSSRRAIATESSTKLVVNLVLSVIALAALAKLLPYNMSQQKSLEELQVKVAEVESRVDRLQTDFNHHFDPKQARLVMQEESTRIDPGQRQIVWVTPERATAQQPVPQKVTPNAQAEYR
jgi:hypothetical protein